MIIPKILQKLSEKETKPSGVAEEVMKKPELLEHIYEGVGMKKPNYKYRSCKVLRIISEKQPELIYPRFNFFVNLLGSESNIFKWKGILVIGNLAKADKQGKIDESVLKKFYSSLNCGKMITANNSIKALKQIALEKPKFLNQIIEEVLKVKNYKYDTEECNLITAGFAIEAISKVFNKLDEELKKESLRFAKHYKDSARNSTAKKAKEFLKKFS